MRFHVGCSFSLRKLKKFLFPILIGFLSYFLGSGLFGFIPVYATTYENYDTTYNITYPELDLTTINVDETHTLQEFLNEMVELGRNSTNYDLLIGIVPYPAFSSLSAYSFSLKIVPKGSLEQVGYNVFTGVNLSYPHFSTFESYNSNITTFNHTYFIGVSYTSYPFGSDYTSNSQFLKIKACLEDNICELNFSTSTNSTIQYIELKHNKPLFNNNDSYTIDLTQDSTYYHSSSPFLISGMVLYYSSFPVIFSNNNNHSDSRYNTFFKSIVLNSQTYVPGDRVPTYCELFGLCTESSPTLATYNYLDDLFVANIPVNNYSNFELKLSFDYFLETFPDNFNIQGFFFGRVDNGTYYSYEPITCSLTGGSAFGNFTTRGTYHISNCLGDLTRYDSLLARFRMSSSQLINNFIFSSNLGVVNIAPIFNGSNNVDFMDYFGSLGPDFSAVVSSTLKDSRLEYIGNSKYTLAQRVNKSTNDITALAQTGVVTFGTNTNSNIMIYNYTLENNSNTDLFLFMSEGSIVSFSDNGAYTYYDESNTIETQNITIKYLIDISGYDSSSLIDILDNFLLDLDSAMIDCHVLFNSIYNAFPSFLSFLILALYTGLLLYLLYKLLKR